MQSVTKRFVLAGVCLIAVGAAVAFKLAMTPEKRFERLIASPRPQSLKMLRYSYQPGREKRAFFHVQLAPSEFPLLLAARPYKLVTGGSTGWQAPLNATLQLFAAEIGQAETLGSNEIYESYDHSAGTQIYIICDHGHSNVFALFLRI